VNGQDRVNSSLAVKTALAVNPSEAGKARENENDEVTGNAVDREKAFVSEKANDVEPSQL
jgi:hypothetical protein